MVLAAALLLTWLDNSQVEDGYLVYRQAQNQRGFSVVAELPANTTRWVDTKTQRNRRYCYYVQITKRGISGGKTKTVCARDNGREYVALAWASDSGFSHATVDEQ